MFRRSFLKSLAAAPAAAILRPQLVEAALPKMKITKVTIFRPPNLNELFNQSNMVVTVETDAGITGVGEGGAKDTLEQCAGTLIGKNPFRIEAIWQEMYIAWFYPPVGKRFTRSARSTWRYGISRVRLWACRFTNCSAVRFAITANVTPLVEDVRPAHLPVHRPPGSV